MAADLHIGFPWGRVGDGKGYSRMAALLNLVGKEKPGLLLLTEAFELVWGTSWLRQSGEAWAVLKGLQGIARNVCPVQIAIGNHEEGKWDRGELRLLQFIPFWERDGFLFLHGHRVWAGRRTERVFDPNYPWQRRFYRLGPAVGRLFTRTPWQRKLADNEGYPLMAGLIDRAVMAWAVGKGYRVVVMGHTHTAIEHRSLTRGTRLINLGSLPEDDTYAVVEDDTIDIRQLTARATGE